MTRLLIITSVLATLVLLKSLNDRPPIWVDTDVEQETTNSVSDVNNTPAATDRFVAARPWPEDLQKSVRDALARWELDQELLPDLYHPVERSEPEERIRAEWVCKQSLLQMAAVISEQPSGLHRLRLSSGDLFPYREIRIGDKVATLDLLDGVQVKVPVSEIDKIYVPIGNHDEVVSSSGSLADTLDIVRMLSLHQSITDQRWLMWFEKGGPETLSRLVSTRDSRIIDGYLSMITRAAAEGADSISRSGKSARELSDWISEMRTKLRVGFPTEDREETLLTLKSWQRWLDRNGDKAYLSRQAFVQVDQELRLLQLDIVKSTGF